MYLIDRMGAIMDAHSRAWSERMKSFDGDSRTPMDVFSAGLITELDFWRCLSYMGVPK